MHALKLLIESKKSEKHENTSKGVKKCKNDMFFFENIKINKNGSGMLDINLPESCKSWLVNYFLFLGAEVFVFSSASLPLSFQSF